MPALPSLRLLLTATAPAPTVAHTHVGWQDLQVCLQDCQGMAAQRSAQQSHQLPSPESGCCLPDSHMPLPNTIGLVVTW